MSSAPFSRYLPEITAFATATSAKAVYCFAIDGTKGTGGSPLVMGMESLKRDVYERRCRELITMLRRSALMLEDDLRRQGFGAPEAP